MNVNEMESPMLVSLLQNRNILSVSAGAVHCIALDADGSVFTWGSHALGQCGSGTIRDEFHPLPGRVQLFGFGRAHSVFAGRSYSLVVTEERKLLTFGYVPGSVVPFGVPRIVPFPDSVRISSTCGGYRHALALTESGEIFVWGSNEYGQLGFGDWSDEMSVPVKLEFDDPVSVVNLGLCRFSAVAASRFNSSSIREDGI